MNSLSGIKGEKEPIVCLSVMDWDHPFPTSRHHLMRAFARQRRVLFVDQPVNIAYALRWAREPRIARKWRVWLRRDSPLRQVEPNLWVLTTPLILPFGRIRNPYLFSMLRRWNAPRVAHSVQHASRRLGLASPILWISLNAIFGEASIGALDERLVVYHCTDEVSTTPNLSPHLPAVERRMLARIDLTIASSRALVEAKRPYCPDIHYVPNAADVAFFEQALDPDTPVPGDLEVLPRPRIIFIGALDFRFDTALLADCARARPDWSWILVGPEDRATFDTGPLAGQPNIYRLGLRPREVIPGYLRGSDAAIIPYRLTEHTRNIYPLKLHEYLAAGRPVVTTPLPDLVEFEPVIRLATSPADFVTEIETSLAQKSEEALQARLAIARANDWSQRVVRIDGLMDIALGEHLEVRHTQD